MDWSNELCIKFMENYIKHDVIWNPNNPNHKNKIDVLQAWESLKEDMGHNGIEVTVPDLKRKKEALMATYRTLEKKVQSAKENGVNYKPSWFCYNIMNTFLHDVYKPKQLKEEPKDFFENSNFDYDDFELTDQNNFIEEKTLKSTKKRKHFEYEDDVNLELDMNQSKHSAFHIYPEHLQKNIDGESDEISLYGALLLAKLRKYDRKTRLIICNKIDNLLFETELNLMDENKSLAQNTLENGVQETRHEDKRSEASSSQSEIEH